MNCQAVQEHLSAYHDGELSEREAARIAAHVASCPSCAEQLRVFRAMSEAYGHLPVPEAPRAWQELDSLLRLPTTGVRQTTRGWTLRSSIAVAVAVIIVLGISITYVAWTRHSHALAAAFGRFLDDFADSPKHAEDALAKVYAGTSVTLAEAEHVLKYKPVVSQGLPPGYTVKSAYVMKMPCCTCLQVNLANPSGDITVFEHDDEQENWFGSRPSIEAVCAGRKTMLVQLQSSLAVICRHDSHCLTIVGVRDLEEVETLTSFWMTQPQSGMQPRTPDNHIQ